MLFVSVRGTRLRRLDTVLVLPDQLCRLVQGSLVESFFV
jgi:hypothetical protein